jgi:hypothetical protein
MIKPKLDILSFEPENRRLRRQFLQLPFRLHRDDPNWVPPLMIDQRGIFNRKRNNFYRHGEALFLLALENGQAVGRLAVLCNQGSQAGFEQDAAHFYLYETERNPEITKRMFDIGTSWAKEHGLKRLLGPKGMSPLDGLGLLVRGFDHRPAFGMPYNPPFYPDLLTEYGFQNIREIESGYLNPQIFSMPEKVFRAAELVQERKGFRVLQLHSRKDLREAIHLLGKMYNGALTGTDGNVALSDEDLDTITGGLLWIAQPELIKLILKDEQPVGFLLAYPDISAGLQATRGRIFPFGWIRLLWEKSHTSWIDINGAGIIAEYRGMAATALLFAELFRSVTASGQFKHAEVIQIGVENERMRRELQGMGIDFYKTHGLFELEI